MEPEIRVTPPPREGWFAYRRRTWWRSRGRYGGLRYWMITRGLRAVTGYAALFCLTGLVIGWRDAFDVSLQITSPADTDVPILAGVLAVVGWLLAPGLAGAVAGYLVSNAISTRRSRPAEPGDIDNHDDRRLPHLAEFNFANGYGVDRNFLAVFVELHDGRWAVASDHWERSVEYLLDTDAVDPQATPGEAMHQAVVHAVDSVFRRAKPQCPWCRRSADPPLSPANSADPDAEGGSR